MVCSEAKNCLNRLRWSAMASKKRERESEGAGLRLLWYQPFSCSLAASLLCSLPLRQVACEPIDGALENIAAVSGIADAVAFIGIDHQLCGNATIAECVPELEGLRSRAFSVAIAYEKEGGGGDVLDEVDS